MGRETKGWDVASGEPIGYDDRDVKTWYPGIGGRCLRTWEIRSSDDHIPRDLPATMAGNCLIRVHCLPDLVLTTRMAAMMAITTKTAMTM